jgi:hypothetical protein
VDDLRTKAETDGDDLDIQLYSDSYGVTVRAILTLSF